MEKRKYDISLLNHPVIFDGPAEFTDLVEVLGGKEDDAMDTVIKAQAYRAWASKVRDKFFELVEEAVGVKIEPLTPAVPANGDTPGKAATWPTDRNAYKFLAGKANISVEQAVKDWQVHMDAAALAIDFIETLKGALAPARVGKEFVLLGNSAIARTNEEYGGDWEPFRNKMATLLGPVTVTTEPTPEEIGGIIKRFVEAQKKTAAGF